MAKKVATLPTTRKRTHNWDQYLNGDKWELTRGEDFTVAPSGMRVQAFLAAKRRGVKVKTHIAGSKLYLQAHYQRRASDARK